MLCMGSVILWAMSSEQWIFYFFILILAIISYWGVIGMAICSCTSYNLHCLCFQLCYGWSSLWRKSLLGKCYYKCVAYTLNVCLLRKPLGLLFNGRKENDHGVCGRVSIWWIYEINLLCTQGYPRGPIEASPCTNYLYELHPLISRQ